MNSTLENWLEGEIVLGHMDVLFGWWDDEENEEVLETRWEISVLDDGTAVTWCLNE